MSMRTYALFDVAIDVTNDLIDLYIRDALNEHEDKVQFAWDLMDDFEALETSDLETQRDIVIQHLNEDYGCYRNDGDYTIYDFTRLNLDNGRFENQIDSDYFISVGWTMNAFKPMFDNMDDLIKQVELSLPYIPEGWDWREHIGWINGTIYG